MRALIAGCLMMAAGGSAFAAGLIGKAGATEIDADQVRALLATLPEASRQAAARDIGVLEQVVRADLANRAVLAEAKAAGFERKAETLNELSRARDEALARLWLLNQAQVPAGYPTESDIASAYDANKAALQAPTEYRLAQIFVAAPNGADPATLAQALRKVMDLAPRLTATSEFGKLAREQSEQKEAAAKGGDLGWLADDKILPEVLAAVRTLKPGEIAGPVKTAQGFHFIKMIEKKAGRVLTLAESRERLRAALRTRRAQELQQKYLAELGNKLSVSINQIELASLQAALLK
jgi:peptidylprolyl isomerase